MQIQLLEQIHHGLLETRQNLTAWLRTTPPYKKQELLGPANDQAVEAHLRVIETALGKAAHGTLGICEICHGYVDDELLQMDYTACVCIDHLSMDEKRQLEQELELSQIVHRALLPQQAPEIPGLEMSAFNRPAQFIGGDYFDFFPFADGSQGLVIADVAGHGVSASLLMASVQTALRTLAPQTESPAEVVQQMNRFFYHNIHFTTFVTLFLGRLDPVMHTLQYCNAGQNPPLLFRTQPAAADEITWLHATGPAIGLIEDYVIQERTIPFTSGDALLLYTDGVTEASNVQREEFGSERLAAVVRQHAGLPAKELVRAVRSALQEFTIGQPPADDITILICRANEK